jgi:hypothetical protein
LRGVDEHSFHVLCLSRARPFSAQRKVAGKR